MFLFFIKEVAGNQRHTLLYFCIESRGRLLNKGVNSG